MSALGIFLAITFIFVNSTLAQEKINMEKLEWIIDRWGNTSDGTSVYESWERVNDSLFKGESKTVKDDKIIFSEKLSIEKIGDNIFYTADVKHNPEPVHFKLINLTDTSATFENPEHDFPQRIIYELRNNTTLYARIEGKVKDKIESSEFIMDRLR